MKKQNQDFNKLQNDFNQLQTQFSELENQLKRAVADYQNLEKRVSEGRSELTNWATTELIKKLLGVLDHYEKALIGAPDNDKQSSWFKGVELATGQLRNVLQSEGLEEIEIDPGSEPGTGTRFDPALHEAVDSRNGEHDTILEVVEKGYNLGGKVLRPAKVVVGRKG